MDNFANDVSELMADVGEYINDFNKLSNFKKNIVSDLSTSYKEEDIELLRDRISKLQSELAETIDDKIDVMMLDNPEMADKYSGGNYSKRVKEVRAGKIQGNPSIVSQSGSGLRKRNTACASGFGKSRIRAKMNKQKRTRKTKIYGVRRT